MDFQIIFRVESLLAMLTKEWSILGVHSHMAFQSHPANRNRPSRIAFNLLKICRQLTLFDISFHTLRTACRRPYGVECATTN